MLRVRDILVSRKEPIGNRFVSLADVALVTSAIADSILIFASLMFSVTWYYIRTTKNDGAPCGTLDKPQKTEVN